MLEYEEIHKNFCTNLKAIRKQRNMTQKKFAKLLGIERALYAKYETGAASTTLKKLIKITSALDISVESLLFSKNSKNIDT